MSWLRGRRGSSADYTPVLQQDVEATSPLVHKPRRTRIRISIQTLACASLLVLAFLFLLSPSRKHAGPSADSANRVPLTSADRHSSGPAAEKDSTRVGEHANAANTSTPNAAGNSTGSLPSIIASDGHRSTAPDPIVSTDAPLTLVDAALAQRRLHFLLPATRGDDHLCKALFSAAVNGYPSPVLINWAMEPEQDGSESSHLKKVSGVAKYLESLGPEASGDLVLMTDAFDVWFQLPKDALLAKYEQVLRASDGRIVEELGPGAIGNGIWSSVIFGADKGCYGFQQDAHECWLQPESPLPIDLYGDKTDRTDHGWTYRSSFRPRWLNSGFVLGPVSDLLGMFERTQEYIDRELWSAFVGSNETEISQSDQRIFQMVYAEQQFNRMMLSMDHPDWSVDAPPHANRISPGAAPSTTMDLDVHPNWSNIRLDSAKNYEFGIAVDFNSTLAFNSNGADFENAFLLHSSGVAYPRVILNDPRDCHVHVRDTLPELIRHANLPSHIKDTIGFKSWERLPLLTNVCTGEIPVVVHHNGDKSQRERQWGSMWYTRHWEKILALWQDDDFERSDVNKGSAYTESGQKLTWDGICKLWEDKLFMRDFVEFPPMLDPIE